MKRRLIGLCLAVMCTAAALSGCGKEEFTCGLCGRTVTEEPQKVTVLGQEFKACEGCHELF